MSYRRFWIAFAAWLAASTLLVGIIETVESAHGLRKFGGLEYIARVVALSAVRETGGGAVFAAALIAWLAWSHRMDPDITRANFRRVALRVTLVAPVAYPLAVALAMTSSFSVAAGVYGIPWQQSVSSYRAIIEWSDWANGAVMAVCSLAALVVLSFFAMPRLSSLAWSLPRKILVALAVFAALRISIALAHAGVRSFLE